MSLTEATAGTNKPGSGEEMMKKYFHTKSYSTTMSLFQDPQ